MANHRKDRCIELWQCISGIVTSSISYVVISPRQVRQCLPSSANISRGSSLDLADYCNISRYLCCMCTAAGALSSILSHRLYKTVVQTSPVAVAQRSRIPISTLFTSVILLPRKSLTRISLSPGSVCQSVRVDRIRILLISSRGSEL